MKRIGYIVLLLLTTATVFAQPRQKFERIHAIKVAYITDKINLTPQQAAEFWPVYNRFDDELFSTRRKYLQDADDREAAKDDLELQQAMLDIRKKYQKEFLKIISEQQLNDLYAAEREFKKMLLQQLKDRRDGGGGRMRR